MAGSATSQLRSAYVAETTPGTIPATPGFTTSHQRIAMQATPQAVHGRSLIGKGARMGHGVSGIPVTGEIPQTGLIYGVYDDWIASLLQGAWSSNVLKDGKSHVTNAVENTIPAGVGGTNTMMRYRGVEATTMTLNLSAGSEAQFSMDLVGMGSDDATTTAISGATYTDPTEADVLTSGADVGTITMAGYTLDCMESLEISLTYENRDPQPKISSDDLCGVTRGDLIPTLTGNFLLEANFAAIYNAARARHSSFALTIPLGSVSGEKYTMLFPACHFEGPEIDFSQPGAMQKVPIAPHYDTTEDCVVKITRAVS